MSAEIQAIEHHIGETRRDLDANLEALQRKIRVVTDWRRYMRTGPLVLVGLVLSGGILLIKLFGGRTKHKTRRRH